MEELFRSYHTALCYHAYTVTRDRELSADLVQEVFVRFWEHNRHSVIDNPKAWLYRSVHNAALNAVAKRNTYQRAKGRMASEEIDREKTRELILIESETARLLWGSVQELPTQCREVIRLGFVEGLSNREIAERLQLHVSTVKTQKQRGLSMLRKIVTHFGIWFQLCHMVFF